MPGKLMSPSQLLKSGRTHRSSCPRSAPGEQGGFTLIEVLIAAAVLAIALAGILSAMVRTTQLDESFGKRSVALKGMENMMAQIRSQPRMKDGKKVIEYIENVDDDPTDSINEFNVDGLEPDNDAEGRITYSKSDGVLKVHLTVNWTDIMGDQQVSLTSFLFIFKKN